MGHSLCEMIPRKHQWGQGEYPELEPIMLRSLLLSTFWQDSSGCQVQPRRADQASHVSTSRRQTSSTCVGRTFTPLLAKERASVSYWPPVLTTRALETDQPLGFSSVIAPCALSLPEVSLGGDQICLALERLCSTMGTTTGWVITTVCEKNWRGQ